MDSFEDVVAAILRRRGYWTQTSVKVELSKTEKRNIGRYSTPRWELDIVAYRGASNELAVVECKSFLDSPGVRCDVFDGQRQKDETRYKLFFDDTLRKVVLRRLVEQFAAAGFCPATPKVSLCLAAGKIYRNEEERLGAIFERRGWHLWGPSVIRSELEKLRDSGYENSVAAVVAKLLLRGSVAAARQMETPSNMALHRTAPSMATRRR